MGIEIHLLGTPRIQVDGKDIFFTYGKVQALIYYMVVKGVALRDEISGLLWPEKSEINARKNLRNAIYEAKKLLGADVFVSPRNAVLQWNPTAHIYVDVHQFQRNPKQYIDIYKGEFLQGFYVKDAEAYEDWYLGERSRLKSMYMNAVYDLVDTGIEEKNITCIERYIPVLLSYDPYNEERFSAILELLMSQGFTTMGKQLYHQLQCIYADDLDESVPDSLREAMHLPKVQKEEAVSFVEHTMLKGRDAEAGEVQKYLYHFEDTPLALRITGDTGSGKTSLVEYIRDKVESYRCVLDSQCYEEEQGLLLHAWIPIVGKVLEEIELQGLENIELRRIYEIFPQLDRRMARDLGFLEVTEELPFNVVYQAVSNLLEQVSEEIPFTLIFEDVQWMDSLSFSLLSLLLLHHSSERLMIIVTDVEEVKGMHQRTLQSLEQQKVLQSISLLPLSDERMRAFILDREPTLQDTDIVNQLVEVSRGNLLVLIESMQLWKEYGSIYGLTKDMELLYSKKCDTLAEEERKLVEFISLFYNEAPLGMIEQYMGLDKLRLLQTLEELERKGFIDYRTQHGEVQYSLKQFKCKEYLGDQMAIDRRQILHAYLGEAWEKRLTHSKEDMIRYKQLEFHFREAGQYQKAVMYKLKSFMHYLNFNKDASPELGVGELSSVYAGYFMGEVTGKALQEIEDELAHVYTLYGNVPEVRALELPYLYGAGKYYMSIGDKERGLQYFQELLEESTEQEASNYKLKAYKELIYYHLQRRHVLEIHQYTTKALALAEQYHFKKEIGVILRLKALAFIMEGQPEQAIPLLEESIRLFSVTQTVARRYAINIAAAYNYLGDIEKSRSRLEMALEMYQKALNYCDQTELYSSWIVFATNAGMTAFALQEYELASTYFQNSYELCLQYTISRRRPTIEAYLGLLARIKGDTHTAVTYLESAQSHGVVEQHGQEVGRVHWAICFLKNEYPGAEVEQAFSESLDTYGTIALQQLDGYGDVWERTYLEQLLQFE